MGIRLFKEPALEDPILVACWPGIGSVGMMAINTLRGTLKPEEFGEIEPWDYAYPRKAVVRNGVLQDLQFPTNKFFFKKTEKRDLMFFIGEEQPAGGRRSYAEGAKAAELANLVLDVAVKFGCRRIYTTGAALAPIHHTARSRVWAVPNSPELIPELRGYANTVLMSDVEGRGGQGNISGLNGLLLGVAKKRGLEAICVMGEMPIYLQGFRIPYPKGSKAVLEVLSAVLGVRVETEVMNTFIDHSEREIEGLYETFLPDVKEQVDKLKYVASAQAEAAGPGPITDEDKKRILEDIDKLFKSEP